MKRKKFHDRKHDYTKLLLSNGKLRTRKQIIDYYNRNAKKIFPWLVGRRVMIYFSHGGKLIRRRKHNEEGLIGKWIVITKMHGIDDPKSFEYYVYRNAIEFHPSVLKFTDLVWIDLDAHSANTKKMLTRRVLKKFGSLLRNTFSNGVSRVNGVNGVNRVNTLSNKVGRLQYWESANGYHITLRLKRKVNTTAARKALQKAFLAADFPSNFKVGLIDKKKEVRVDLATLKPNGSLRAPYSLSFSGHIKRPFVIQSTPESISP
jgi:hypothetical protein